MRLNADKLRSAAKEARQTASTEVLTHNSCDDFATPPRSSGTRGPRTSSSDASSKATHGSTSAHDKDPDIDVVYDLGLTASPRGKADTPLSPIVKLSTSIPKTGGPAAMKWNSEHLHRFTRKGGEISKSAIRAKAPASLPSHIHLSP